MVVPLSKVVIDLRMRGMCRLAYPNHRRGCPNFGKKLQCPPDCPMFTENIDITKPMFAIVNEFDLGAHVERLRAKYPAWTLRQLQCCLYWQPKARKALRAEIAKFRKDHPQLFVDECPEAGGVNVTETLRNAGIELEWPPMKIARQVAIAGSRNV